MPRFKNKNNVIAAFKNISEQQINLYQNQVGSCVSELQKSRKMTDPKQEELNIKDNFSNSVFFQTPFPGN